MADQIKQNQQLELPKKYYCFLTINRIIFSNIVILKYIQYTNSNNVDDEDVSMHEDTPIVDNKDVNNNKDDNNDKTDSTDEDSSLSSLTIQSEDIL